MSAFRLHLLTMNGSPSEGRAGDEPALAIAMAFLDHMAGLPAAAWVEAGRSMLAQRATLAGHAGARHGLLSALWHQELTWSVWCVRDGLETASHLARGNGQGLTVDERPLFDLACAAAGEAALALLSRDRLPAADLSGLYAPFESLVPLASLAPLD